MSAVPESEQVLGFWREYCRAVISWPDMPTDSGSTRKYQRNPLRCVVQREILQVRTDWGPLHLIYNETLSCGHRYTCSPILTEQFTALRRRCAACGEREASRPAPRLSKSRGPDSTADATRRPRVVPRQRRLAA